MNTPRIPGSARRPRAGFPRLAETSFVLARLTKENEANDFVLLVRRSPAARGVGGNAGLESRAAIIENEKITEPESKK